MARVEGVPAVHRRHRLPLGRGPAARWDEIDRGAETWTIPGGRSKTQRPHVVPLSKMALAALAEAHRYADGSGHVFPAPTGRGRALSDSCLSKLLRENDIPGTVHGMRASFRSWAAEQGIPARSPKLNSGMSPGRSERAYQRSDLLDARCKVMDDWSEYLSST